MLSPNEKRTRAAKFAEEWKSAGYERGESQSFYNDFFHIFGIQRRRVASFEEPVKKLGDKQGFIDLFWKGKLLVEQKSAGLSLKKAKEQALEYFPGLKEAELPRYILACDFQTFELHDLEDNKSHAFGLQELPDKLKHFAFMDGGQLHELKDEDPVNIKASELMGEVHDALKASGFEGHNLERFLVRLVFCLFADDTGIFESGILTSYIETRTAEDGHDLGSKLNELFEVLNQHEDKRQKKLDEDLARFPYINGRLFEERLAPTSFDSSMRSKLLEACYFDWSKVSPAIFGSLFQSVMDKKKRRAIGAHYTNEQNILKVIGPLFLDDLKDELKRLKARKDNSRTKALQEFQGKLAKLTFFDPACGCGNFLVISYREIRLLEMDVILDLKNNLDLFKAESQCDVDQFYGIEIEEFPSLIAEIAMWMMDHLMNRLLSEKLSVYLPRIPLKKSPKIVHADALEIDWATVLRPDECSFVFGNPPFSGKKEQSKLQKTAMARIFSGQRGAGTLDFVAAWFKKAYEFCKSNQFILTAFVATKSICQGEQVAILWPALLESDRWQIRFAHRTFEWSSEAKGKAHVHVVIVGLGTPTSDEKRLFEYEKVNGQPVELRVSKINAYLTDGSQTFVRRASKPISKRPNINKGSEATDFGHLVLKPEELIGLRASNGWNENWLRRYTGGREFINSQERYCLWLKDADPEELHLCKLVMDRIEAVAKDRKNSKKKRTRDWAKYPFLFSEDRQPKTPYIIAPKVSSQTREYVPFGYLGAETIVSGSAQFIASEESWLFAILISRMHMSWMRAVGGRTKSDYQYTNTLIFNTFPLPDISQVDLVSLASAANGILSARREFPMHTLASLYRPKTMPANLRKAHEANDKSVDQLYRKEAFASDRERVEFLLARYEQITAPALALAAAKPKKARKIKAT